ncbi:MAG: hypothetical protein ACK559_03705, partial [bacterium]
VAQHVVVPRQVPFLDMLQPRHDVVAVAHQIGIIRTAERRREERYHVDRIIEQLGEAPEFGTHLLGVADQALLHEVGERTDKQHAALRQGEVFQQGEE